MSVKFCNECGHKNIRAAKFCLECGFRFEDAVPEKKQVEPKKATNKDKAKNKSQTPQKVVDQFKEETKVEVVSFSPFKVVDPVEVKESPEIIPKQKKEITEVHSIPKKTNKPKQREPRVSQQNKAKNKVVKEDTNENKIKRDNHSKVKTKVPSEAMNVDRGFNIGKKTSKKVKTENKKDSIKDNKQATADLINKSNKPKVVQKPENKDPVSKPANKSKPSTSDFINKNVNEKPVVKPTEKKVVKPVETPSPKKNNNTQNSNNNKTQKDNPKVETIKSSSGPSIGSLDMFLKATNKAVNKTPAEINKEKQDKIKKDARLAAERKSKNETEVNKSQPLPFDKPNKQEDSSTGPAIKKFNIDKPVPPTTKKEQPSHDIPEIKESKKTDVIIDEIYEDEVVEDVMDDIVEDIIDEVEEDIIDDIVDDFVDDVIVEDVIEDVIEDDIIEDVIIDVPENKVVKPVIKKEPEPIVKDDQEDADDIVQNLNPNSGLSFEVKGSVDGALTNEELSERDDIDTENDIDIDSLAEVKDKTLAESGMDFSYLADEESELDRNRLTSGISEEESIEKEELPESEVSGRSVASRLEAKRDLITQKDIDKRKLYIIDQEKEVIPNDVIQDEYYSNVKPIDHDLVVSKRTFQEMFQDRAAIIVLVVVAPIIFGLMTLIMSFFK